MARPDWHNVKELFHEALRLEENERAGFLDNACRGDINLRIEVESLLVSLADAQSFLEIPIVGEPSVSQNGWRLDEGQVISHYRVRSPIAIGGMGEVYLAEDLNLHRDVALKILSGRVLEDRGRLRRFQHEAAVVSALNHPNILTVFEFGNDGGVDFLACELVKGVTLRERLGGGPMPVSEALDVSVQILSALRAAHAAGVIHRDIKPENVMVRDDGYVKVLDFGLAKLTDPASEENIDTTKAFSVPGFIMGTVKYMSPEQTRGHSIDERSDLFSSAVVLYEMLTGRPPFTGETASDVVAAIIQADPPPPGTLVAGIPPEVDAIVQRGMAKQPSERYASAEEMLAQLKRAKKHNDRSDEYYILPASRAKQAAAGTENVTIDGSPASVPGRRSLVAAAAMIAAIALAILYFVYG